MQAHRLLELVESRVSKSILAENLFNSYFTLGVDIGNKNNLLDIGKKSCINENILKIFLDSDEGLKEVKKKEEKFIIKSTKVVVVTPESKHEIIKRVPVNNEKIIEVPIRYKGRTYEKGKKITIKDGFLALKTLIKYRYFN